MSFARWSFAVPDWKDRIKDGRPMLPDLPLFDAQAEKALRIFKRLRVPDIPGNPTYGEACGQWVFDIVRAIFGAYDPETKQRAIREVFLLVPKKNGKSSIAAAIMVTASIMNERPQAECLLIAPTKEIANISFSQAAGIIRLDERLSTLFRVRDHIKTIENLNEAIPSSIVIKAADTDTITGSKATYILIDETHVFASKAKAAEVFVEIRGSLAARPDGFLFQITTQSKTPPAGVFKAELTKARKVRDGELDLPILSVLYELPIEVAANGGWRDPRTWGMVNPNLNVSVNERYLADEITAAEIEGPEKLALIASQHFNVEVGLGLHADRWPAAIYWEAAIEPGLTLDQILETSDVCTIGIDGGGLDDLMGLAVIGRHAQTRVWQAWVHAWAHPEVFDRRKEIAPRLRDFAAVGDLTVVEDPDQDVIEAADICDRLWQNGLLPERAGIGLDAFGVATLLEVLDARGIAGDLTVAIGQGWKLQQSVLTLPRKVKDRTFRHCGQPLAAWAVGNAKLELRGSNYIMTKQAAGAAKIDPVIALLNAAELMSRNPAAALVATPWDRDPDYRMTA